MAMIETKKLRKVFGPIEAVKGVSFRVEKGEVLGFLGPNGAGKSTVMRMLTGFLTPTDGTAVVGGHDVIEDSMAARRCVGYVPESNPVYDDMTADSFLRFVGELRGLRGEALRSGIDGVVETCRLSDVRHQPLETLSKGYKRRVGLAQALIHDPEILILDEPTDGLDPNQKHEVRALINRMASEKAIIISTHILEEVEAVCTRAIVIAEGRIVADDTPDGLKKRSRWHGALSLTLRTGEDKAAEKLLTGVKDVDSVELVASSNGSTRFRVFPKNARRIAADVLELVNGKGWRIEEFTEDSGRLDEVFRDITSKGSAGS